MSGARSSLLAASLLLAGAAFAAPRQNVIELLTARLSEDRGFTDAQRQAVLDAIKQRFAAYGFDVVDPAHPEASLVVLRMIVEGSFDEVSPARIADVSFAAYQAISRGSPPDVVEGLALYGYRKNVSADRISTWANGYRQMTDAKVPAGVAADLIRNALERDWDDQTFNTLKWAFVQAAKDGFNARDYAVYVLGAMQKPGAMPGATSSQAHSYFASLAGRAPELPEYHGTFNPKPAPEPAAPKAAAPKVEEPKPRTRPVQKEAPVSPTQDHMSVLWPHLDASAMSYLGTPYVWGGETHEGIDCSALTQNSYGENKVRIPRVSRDQWKTGASVTDLKPGDLIFFNTMGTGVSHVGMVVDSKGPRFIHASSSHGVVLADLSRPYYQQRYLGARRIVP